jgi:hypothetical protein
MIEPSIIYQSAFVWRLLMIEKALADNKPEFDFGLFNISIKQIRALN